MSPVNRKEFIRMSALAMTSLAVGSSFDIPKKKVLLSFSTLGCPDWTFLKIAEFAAQHGYRGLEIRGIQRQMDLTKVPEFSTDDSRRQTLALMKRKKLSFVNLGSSATLHFAEGAEREKNLTEGRQVIDLAQQLRCPFVRVFPNNFPKEREKKETIDLIVKGLKELGTYAGPKGVMVLMETHGDAVWINDLTTIMQAVDHTNVGLIWDAANMWTVTKEPPALAYEALKNFIRHTHIKDAKMVNGKPEYTLLGRGDVPIFEAVDALQKGGYKGFYSFEWEKLWHPELPEPEMAIADYPVAMNKHFERV
jgi:sugar phosphate isomerase/epimerase